MPQGHISRYEIDRLSNKTVSSTVGIARESSLVIGHPLTHTKDNSCPRDRLRTPLNAKEVPADRTLEGA